MARLIIVYLSTLLVMVPLDLLFLGVLAKGFFQSQVGELMGDVNLPAAILFYLMYAAGIVVFVNSGADVTWKSCLLYGALLGLFCYGTFDLTSLTIIKGWKWQVAAVDMSWGALVTGVSAAVGLMLSQWIGKQL